MQNNKISLDLILQYMGHDFRMYICYIGFGVSKANAKSELVSVYFLNRLSIGESGVQVAG